MPNDQTVRSDTSFCSSLTDDVWHNLAGPNAFESWHFDAMSDDGREALVITFYDNYVLSPRFHVNSVTPVNVIQSGKHRFPAVSFVYSVNGKTVLSSVNEYVDGDFRSSPSSGCTVGGSTFNIDTAEYGTGFVVTVDILTRRSRRIHAELEWLLIESDLMPPGEKTAAVWNLVAPRADVSGRIELIGRRGKVRKQIPFRGTGYHDHISSENVHYRELASRMWGRAHFVDSTVVFERRGGAQDSSAAGKFFLIREGEIGEHDAECRAVGQHRDRWGLLTPLEISFVSGDIELRVTPRATIRSGYSEVKMVSEVELTLNDGRQRKAPGITEFVDPRRMRSRLSRWVSDLRIGRNGRSPAL